MAVAVLAAGAAVWAVAIRETAYERCFRVAHDSFARGQQSLAAVVAPDPAINDDAARGTCDYLQAHGRLGEMSEETALPLLREATRAKFGDLLDRMGR